MRRIKVIRWGRVTVLAVTLALVVFGLAACGGGKDKTPTSTPIATATPTETATPVVTETPTPAATSTPVATATPVPGGTIAPTPGPTATISQNMPPCRVLGIAKVNGVNAPAGTTVTAFIEGVQVGQGTVTDTGTYKVQFTADSYLGKTVTFQIGTANAAETAEVAYGLVKIDLTATS